jgi:hypothetical protein
MSHDGADPAAPTKEPDKLTALEQKLDALSKNLTITRQTTLTAVVSGPEICGFQSSAVIAAFTAVPLSKTCGIPPHSGLCPA